MYSKPCQTSKMESFARKINGWKQYFLSHRGITLCVKNIQIWSFFWSVFSCIRTEYRKIRTRKNSTFGYFPRSGGNKENKFHLWTSDRTLTLRSIDTDTNRLVVTSLHIQKTKRLWPFFTWLELLVLLTWYLIKSPLKQRERYIKIKMLYSSKIWKTVTTDIFYTPDKFSPAEVELETITTDRNYH